MRRQTYAIACDLSTFNEPALHLHGERTMIFINTSAIESTDRAHFARPITL